ncbi:SWI/SNF complex component snf12 [Lambiella insularis]|nr:SWI/SNF complex component snf12 [Lambiella insularis]
MNAATHPQAQYRNYQQSTQRSPHAPSSRRGIGSISGGNQGQSALQQQQAHRDAAQRVMEAAAKTRAKQPTDKNIPEGVEDVIVGDGVKQYRDLREVERRLDAVMMRKRLDLHDIRPQSHDRMRTLRIWISNTAENQPWQGRGLDENAFDFNTGMEGIYKVKIEGRVLEDEDPTVDSDAEDETDKEAKGDGQVEESEDAMDHDGGEESTKKPTVPSKPRQKMSHFFKTIIVEYDRNKNLQPENAGYIEWKKPPVPPNTPNPLAAADFDYLEFERKSDENINCTINLYRDENPERFAVSKELAEIIDVEEATRERVVTGIWEYAHAMHLQQDEEKRLIQCDERLRAVFKQDTIFFPHLTDIIVQHLSPLPPIKLPYTIRVDPEYHAAPSQTIYDILIPAEDTLRTRMLAITRNPAYPATLSQIADLDKQLALIVQAITDSKAKHAFFTSMSKDPKTFVKRWISSQKRDLEIILGEATKGGGEDGLGEEFRRGGKDGVWGTENVRESVGLMVAKR